MLKKINSHCRYQIRGHLSCCSSIVLDGGQVLLSLPYGIALQISNYLDAVRCDYLFEGAADDEDVVLRFPVSEYVELTSKLF